MGGAIVEDTLDHAVDKVCHGGIIVAAFVAHLLNMQRQQVSEALNGEWRIYEEELQSKVTMHSYLLQEN